MKFTVAMNKEIVFPQSDFKIVLVAGNESFLNDAEEAIFHEEIEIKYFYEGSSVLMVGTEVIATQPGYIVIVNPYEFHTTIDVGQNKGRYHLINLSLDFLKTDNFYGLDLRRLLFGKGMCFSNLIRENCEMQQLIDKVVGEMQKKESSYKLMVRCLMTEFFVIAARNSEQGDRMSPMMERKLYNYRIIEPVLQYIYSSYNQKITLDDLVKVSGVSKYHLSRVFRQCTGVTIMQYLTNYRLKISNTLLIDTDKNIQEIAEICGFSDSGYFCHCYKKVFGISPGRNRMIK